MPLSRGTAVYVGIAAAATACLVWLAFGGEDPEDDMAKGGGVADGDVAKPAPASSGAPARRQKAMDAASTNTTAPPGAAGPGSSPPRAASGDNGSSPPPSELPTQRTPLLLLIAMLDPTTNPRVTVQSALGVALQHTNHGTMRRALVKHGVVARLARLMQEVEVHIHAAACLVMTNLTGDAAALQAAITAGTPAIIAKLLVPLFSSSRAVSFKAALMLSKNMAMTDKGTLALLDAGVLSSLKSLACCDDADTRAGALQVLLNMSCVVGVRPRLAPEVAPILHHVAFELPLQGLPMSYGVLATLARTAHHVCDNGRGLQLMAAPGCVRAVASIALSLLDDSPPLHFFGPPDAKHQATLLVFGILRAMKHNSPVAAEQVEALAARMRQMAARADAVTPAGDSGGVGAGAVSSPSPGAGGGTGGGGDAAAAGAGSTE